MTLGEQLRKIRKQQRVRLVQLERLSSLSASSISRFEKNQTAPSITTVESLFDLLGYKVIVLPKEVLQ